MRIKVLTVVFAILALGCWSYAQTADTDSGNPNGNITITSGPNVTPQSNSATITWNTSGRAATFVKYGTDPNNLSQKSYQAGGKRDHSVTLSDLTPGTTYYFAIMTDDQTVRQKGQFTTTGAASASATSTSAAGSNAGGITITSGPNVTPQSNSATIAWSTSGPAATMVHYGTDPNNLSQKSYQAGGARDHSVTLSNLAPGKTYYFAIMTNSGAVRQNGQFTTTGSASASTKPGSLQIVGPNLALVSANSAQITWTTNAPSSSIVHYGTSKGSLTQTAVAAWGASTHQVGLNNLKPSTTYFVQVESAQAQG